MVQVLSLLAVIILSPVYENAQAKTSSVCPFNCWKHEPSFVDHSLAVLSKEAVKSWWPFGLKQTVNIFMGI